MDIMYRFLLEALDNQTKSAQEGNKALEWLMCCVKCCAWCLEKIVMFINRNAYIMVGIKGTNYCSSACRALKLVLSVRHFTFEFCADGMPKQCAHCLHLNLSFLTG